MTQTFVGTVWQRNKIVFATLPLPSRELAYRYAYEAYPKAKRVTSEVVNPERLRLNGTDTQWMEPHHWGEILTRRGVLKDAMLQIATPICKTFLTDVTKHDFVRLDKAQTNDVFLWAPYASGSVMVCLRGWGEAFDARESFKACEDVLKPQQWYMLVMGDEQPHPLTNIQCWDYLNELAEKANGNKFKGY